MNDSRRDGYVVLAICIATAAIFATVFNAVQTIQDFDPSTSIALVIIGNVFSQTSLALAMVCAVIIGRNMWLNKSEILATSPEPTEAPNDTIDNLG